MKININYKGNDYNEIEKLISLAYKGVEVFFDEKPENINVKIHKTRKDFEEKLNRKTFEWEVANASYSGSIDILHPNSFARESTHKKEEFLFILKHEFSHIFIDLLSNGHKIPKWLDEGFSSYIAGFNNIKDFLYIEENFCKKLGTPKGWDEYSNYYAYNISQMFVEFLIKKFSIKKVNKLISTLKKNYYYASFSKNFKKIFGKNIENTEREFVESLNIE